MRRFVGRPCTHQQVQCTHCTTYNLQLSVHASAALAACGRLADWHAAGSVHQRRQSGMQQQEYTVQTWYSRGACTQSVYAMSVL